MAQKTISKKRSGKKKEAPIIFSLFKFFFEDEIHAARWALRFKKGLLIIGVPLLLLVVIYIVAYRLSADTVTFTVTEKPERVYNATDYPNLIYTDKGVYKNVDTITFLKFRSSDVYNQIKVNETFTCKVAGWRFGPLDWYRNIIDCNGFKYY